MYHVFTASFIFHFLCFRWVFLKFSVFRWVNLQFSVHQINLLLVVSVSDESDFSFLYCRWVWFQFSVLWMSLFSVFGISDMSTCSFLCFRWIYLPSSDFVSKVSSFRFSMCLKWVYIQFSPVFQTCLPSVFLHFTWNITSVFQMMCLWYIPFSQSQSDENIFSQCFVYFIWV